MTDYEARYLELASRPGMESLRRECLECRGSGVRITPIGVQIEVCGCQGRGWLPLPEAERMGGLVRVVLSSYHDLGLFQDDFGRVDVWFSGTIPRGCVGSATPEAALTEALLAVK